MKAWFWRESQVFGFQKCKYRLRVASLLNGIASIDGMSLPCSFGCEYRWNVASSWIWVQVSTECRFLAFFSKIWFCGYRWNVASPRFLKFEVFFSLCFLFWNLGCGYQLKRCVSTIFWKFCKYWRGVVFLRFWGFGSIEWGSHPSDFWVLCEYRLNVASPRFFEKPFFV